MPEPTTVERLRGLILSAQDLRSLTDWPDALIEDYLNILDNLITISNLSDTETDEYYAITLVTSDTTLALTNHTVLVDATAADVNITLLSATDQEGKEFIIKKIDSSDNVVNILTTGAETIDGDASQTIQFQNSSMQVRARTNWFII
jgi:hypothetical protein